MKQFTRPQLLDRFTYGNDIQITTPEEIKQHLEVGDYIYSPRDGIRGCVSGTITKLNRKTFTYDVQYTRGMVLHLIQHYDEIFGGLVLFRRENTLQVFITPGMEVRQCTLRLDTK